ncbi:LOW QUALITY PROTEIN: high affinity immunoglobulin gamma Fc receptor I-like [Ascaphus truei]|uniref:LOW QUALITY PROTEIN: high affinity immunoglobulin gamma Fc receptor I-like n=1 Tax=Ascaphus truei TaxID=8439 RepID=UPI003F599BD2
MYGVVTTGSNCNNLCFLGAEVKPEVSFTPSWRKIFTKETVTLTCNVASTAQGHQGYSWYKDGSQRNTKHSRSYIIKTAHVSDSGNYQCETTSSVMSDAVRLDVTYGWVILQVPYSVIEGDSLALRCHAWGDFSVKDTTFYKDSEIIQFSASEFLYLVPSVNMDTGGTYKCVTSLPQDLSSDNYTDEGFVSVQELFSSPEINVRQYPMIEEGGMTIRCNTTLNPRRANTKLEFAFYKNTRTVQGFGISSEYQVNSTGLQHAGDYTCEVKTSTNTVKKKSPVLKVQIHGTHKLQNIIRLTLSAGITVTALCVLFHHVKEENITSPGGSG